MQTRKHPRTLNEAFPRTAEYGCAIERPTKREAFAGYLLAVAIAAGLTWAIVESLTR